MPDRPPVKPTRYTGGVEEHHSMNHGKELDKLLEQLDLTETDLTESEHTTISSGGTSIFSWSAVGDSSCPIIREVTRTEEECSVNSDGDEDDESIDEQDEDCSEETSHLGHFPSPNSTSARKTQSESRTKDSQGSSSVVNRHQKKRDELLQFSQECRKLRIQQKKAAVQREQAQRQFLPHAESSLHEIPIEQRQAVRQARLQQAKARLAARQENEDQNNKMMRRERAYRAYVYRGKPCQADFLAWIQAESRRTPVTMEDVHLLPWTADQSKVDEGYLKLIKRCDV